MGEDYVHWLDSMPEVKQFLAEIRQKEKIRLEEAKERLEQAKREGSTNLQHL